MGLRRGLVSIARVAALVALVLGSVFAVQGITRDGLSFIANPAKADDSTLANRVFMPFAGTPRDDLLSAESNLAVRSVAAGYAHACAVRLDSTLICWGLNQHGQAAPPPGTFEQVTAGANHSCGLRSDSTLACWGDNTYGQSTPPEGTFLQVTAGGYHSCAVRADGTLACWGWNAFQQLEGIPPGTFTQAAAGNLHTCALGADGAAACWGWNADGQASAPAGVFTQVAAGGAHSCAAGVDGMVTCWGSNLSGELDAPPGNYSAVGAGGFHSCGLDANGLIVCWGSNGYGQLVDIPTGAFRQISVGGQHTCAVRAGSGTLACWGWNRYGQSFPPSGVLVSAGRGHACAVRVDGSLSCWGENDYGQAEPPAGAFTRVSAGDGYTCAVRSDGTLDCWGRATDGALLPPAGATAFVDVSAGAEHACALDLIGNITCWGLDDGGKTSPPEGPFSMVSAGASHTCALRVDGTLACWGSGSAGQTNAPAGSYTQVSAGGEHTCARDVFGAINCWGANGSGQTDTQTGTFAQVSAGLLHTCGVRADGLARCWGANGAGESTPPGGIFSQISAGAGYTCAVGLEGAITCWGNPTAAPVIEIAPALLPDAEEGAPYAVTLSASGGTPPYTFAVSAGELPAGLTLSEDGLLSGVPEGDGEAGFSITATDSGDPRFSGQRAYKLRVVPPVIDDTPPIIEAEIDGPLGMNDWYIGPVSVSWRVYDPESPVTVDKGCDTLTLAFDTPGFTVTCQAESAGGAASASVTVRIDQTPPEGVTGTPDRPAENGWYNSPLAVTFSGSDATSGVAACTTAGYSGPDSANAVVVGTCTDLAGNVSAPVEFRFQYDATAPELDPRVEPDPVYLRGEARVIPNASDNLSGLLDVTCQPVDTSAVGEHFVTCRAIDAAGNRAEATAAYHVIYQFVGFLPPVENPPTVNSAVAGQTIPIKFEIYDANNAPVTGLESVRIDRQVDGCSAKLDSVKMEELYLDVVVPLKDLGNGRYQYNWKTSETYAFSCKAILVDLGEGEGFEHVFLVHFRK